MRQWTVLSVFLIAVASPETRAQVVNPANGHTYMLTPAGMSFAQARAYAQAAGGYLVSITDAAEQAFVAAQFSTAGTTRLWIGLSDEVTEGVFRWDSGEPFAYSAWCPGEPNNFNGNEVEQGA